MHFLMSVKNPALQVLHHCTLETVIVCMCMHTLCERTSDTTYIEELQAESSALVLRGIDNLTCMLYQYF